MNLHVELTRGEALLVLWALAEKIAGQEEMRSPLLGAAFKIAEPLGVCFMDMVEEKRKNADTFVVTDAGAVFEWPFDVVIGLEGPGTNPTPLRGRRFLIRKAKRIE